MAKSKPWYVYQGVNHAWREIYYGASPRPRSRIDGKHCRGGTKTLAHWNCRKERPEWRKVSIHPDRASASAEAHRLEKSVPPPGYKIIQTGGT